MTNIHQIPKIITRRESLEQIQSSNDIKQHESLDTLLGNSIPIQSAVDGESENEYSLSLHSSETKKIGRWLEDNQSVRVLAAVVNKTWPSLLSTLLVHLPELFGLAWLILGAYLSVAEPSGTLGLPVAVVNNPVNNLYSYSTSNQLRRNRTLRALNAVASPPNLGTDEFMHYTSPVSIYVVPPGFRTSHYLLTAVARSVTARYSFFPFVSALVVHWGITSVIVGSVGTVFRSLLGAQHKTTSKRRPVPHLAWVDFARSLSLGICLSVMYSLGTGLVLLFLYFGYRLHPYLVFDQLAKDFSLCLFCLSLSTLGMILMDLSCKFLVFRMQVATHSIFSATLWACCVSLVAFVGFVQTEGISPLTVSLIICLHWILVGVIAFAILFQRKYALGWRSGFRIVVEVRRRSSKSNKKKNKKSKGLTQPNTSRPPVGAEKQRKCSYSPFRQSDLQAMTGAGEQVLGAFAGNPNVQPPSGDTGATEGDKAGKDPGTEKKGQKSSGTKGLHPSHALEYARIQEVAKLKQMIENGVDDISYDPAPFRNINYAEGQKSEGKDFFPRPPTPLPTVQGMSGLEEKSPGQNGKLLAGQPLKNPQPALPMIKVANESGVQKNVVISPNIKSPKNKIASLFKHRHRHVHRHQQPSSKPPPSGAESDPTEPTSKSLLGTVLDRDSMSFSESISDSEESSDEEIPEPKPRSLSPRPQSSVEMLHDHLVNNLFIKPTSSPREAAAARSPSGGPRRGSLHDLDVTRRRDSSLTSGGGWKGMTDDMRLISPRKSSPGRTSAAGYPVSEPPRIRSEIEHASAIPFSDLETASRGESGSDPEEYNCLIAPGQPSVQNGKLMDLALDLSKLTTPLTTDKRYAESQLGLSDAEEADEMTENDPLCLTFDGRSRARSALDVYDSAGDSERQKTRVSFGEDIFYQPTLVAQQSPEAQSPVNVPKERSFTSIIFGVISPLKKTKPKKNPSSELKKLHSNSAPKPDPLISPVAARRKLRRLDRSFSGGKSPRVVTVTTPAAGPVPCDTPAIPLFGLQSQQNGPRRPIGVPPIFGIDRTASVESEKSCDLAILKGNTNPEPDSNPKKKRRRPDVDRANKGKNSRIFKRSFSLDHFLSMLTDVTYYIQKPTQAEREEPTQNLPDCFSVDLTPAIVTEDSSIPAASGSFLLDLQEPFLQNSQASSSAVSSGVPGNAQDPSASLSGTRLNSQTRASALSKHYSKWFISRWAEAVTMRIRLLSLSHHIPLHFAVEAFSFAVILFLSLFMIRDYELQIACVVDLVSVFLLSFSSMFAVNPMFVSLFTSLELGSPTPLGALRISSVYSLLVSIIELILLFGFRLSVVSGLVGLCSLPQADVSCMVTPTAIRKSTVAIFCAVGFNWAVMTAASGLRILGRPLLRMPLYHNLPSLCSSFVAALLMQVEGNTGIVHSRVLCDVLRTALTLHCFSMMGSSELETSDFAEGFVFQTSIDTEGTDAGCDALEDDASLSQQNENSGDDLSTCNLETNDNDDDNVTIVFTGDYPSPDDFTGMNIHAFDPEQRVPVDS